MKLALAILCLFTMTNMWAQAPIVMSVTPTAHKVNAAADAAITVTFDTEINPSSITNISFRVMGRWSGPAEGTTVLENDNKTIRFTPDEPFFAGEAMTISISKGIQSSTGENLQKGYMWNYWIATSPTEMNIVPIKTIQLRQPGEGLLQTYGAYAGDLNNDSYSDLTIVNETSDDLRILLNDGAGDYNDFELINMGDGTPSPNEGGDFNNDGELDFAVCTAHNNEVRIFFGDGSGTLTNMETYQTGNGARGLVVIDCNGDGYDDIFITNRLSDDLTMMTNDGDGTFTLSSMNTTGTGETACFVSDANDDGIADIFVANYNSRDIGIMIGDGDGGFTLGETVAMPGQPWMIATGDLNGDGIADVVSANSNANLSVALFGDGQGGLSEPIELQAPNDGFPLAIDLGDMDGDGDLDVVSSNYGGPTYTVFENDGLGNFSVGAVLAGQNLASCAILHDRDNDGDLDVSATDEGDDVVILFENVSMPLNVNFETKDIPFEWTISPNPFSEKVVMDIQLLNATDINVRIHDVQGRLVKTLFSDTAIVGERRVAWDGMNEAGTPMESALYFAVIETMDGIFGKQLFLVK